MEKQKKLERVINRLIDIPAAKLAYAIADKELALGLKRHIPRYGFQYTKEVHDLLVEKVGEKLADWQYGTTAIEFEWDEKQSENFVKF